MGIEIFLVYLANKDQCYAPDDRNMKVKITITHTWLSHPVSQLRAFIFETYNKRHPDNILHGASHPLEASRETGYAPIKDDMIVGDVLSPNDEVYIRPPGWKPGQAPSRRGKLSKSVGSCTSSLGKIQLSSHTLHAHIPTQSQLKRPLVLPYEEQSFQVKLMKWKDGQLSKYDEDPSFKASAIENHGSREAFERYLTEKTTNKKSKPKYTRPSQPAALQLVLVYIALKDQVYQTDSRNMKVHVEVPVSWMASPTTRLKSFAIQTYNQQRPQNELCPERHYLEICREKIKGEGNESSSESNQGEGKLGTSKSFIQVYDTQTIHEVISAHDVVFIRPGRPLTTLGESAYDSDDECGGAGAGADADAPMRRGMVTSEEETRQVVEERLFVSPLTRVAMSRALPYVSSPSQVRTVRSHY
jgi:hypothetical protein